MRYRVLDTPFQRARGVIGRYPAENERYILRYDSVDERGVHMVGVTRPLRVTWVADGEITHEEVLEPWTGTASAEADEIIEKRPVSANSDSTTP